MSYTNREVLVTLDPSPMLEIGSGMGPRQGAWAHWTNERSRYNIDRAKPLCPNSNAPQDLAAALRGRRRFVPIGHVERVRGIAEPDGRSIGLGSGLPAGLIMTEATGVFKHVRLGRGFSGKCGAPNGRSCSFRDRRRRQRTRCRAESKQMSQPGGRSLSLSVWVGS